MAGRPRKPNALKELSGTNQPSRMRDEADFGTITKIPPPPRYMNKYGKKLYKTTTARLNAISLLNDVNLPIVVAYANEMGKYWEAEEILNESGRLDIAKDGEGNIIKVARLPLDKMASEYLSNAKTFAVELGITPASSSKVKAPEPKKKRKLDSYN